MSLPPFQRGSETSRQAAVSVYPSLARLEAVVLEAFEASPNGLTDEELRGASGLSESTSRARRVKLWQLGLLEDSGERRRGSSGRMMTVWRVVNRPSQPTAATWAEVMDGC